jgi:hypothetical protein
MKKIKAPSVLDNKLLTSDSDYPITGTFLEKYNYISILIEKQKTNLPNEEMSILVKEKERLLPRAQAAGNNAFKQFVQYIFSLYPYEEDN